MKTEQRHWRADFEVHPKIPGLSYPYCVQHSSATRGYRIRGMYRKKSQKFSVLKYTLSGCGIIEVKGKAYEVPKGHAFLANVTDPEINYYFPEDGNEIWQFLFFAFLGDNERIARLNQHFGWIYKIPESSWLIRSLMTYQYKASSIKMLLPGEGHAMVQNYLGKLVDFATKEKIKSEKGKLFPVISELVQDQIENRLTLAEIAQQLNMSKEHLCREFKTETGMTVLEYIQKEQIRHASLLLHDNSLSVKEIAYQMGFANPSHFNRQFKKVTDMTPLEYRKYGSIF